MDIYLDKNLYKNLTKLCKDLTIFYIKNYKKHNPVHEYNKIYDILYMKYGDKHYWKVNKSYFLHECIREHRRHCNLYITDDSCRDNCKDLYTHFRDVIHSENINDIIE